MATGTVAVRLPDEVLEQLQKRATAENKKVSDLVRELITSGLREQPRTEDAGNERVIEYLEGFGGVLMAILFETVGSRYFAEMATSYGVDMESLLRQNLPMDKEAKAALMSRFEETANANCAGHMGTGIAHGAANRVQDLTWSNLYNVLSFKVMESTINRQ